MPGRAQRSEQAGGEIHVDQFHNFPVDTLTAAFETNLDESTALDLEDIYAIRAGATADGTSITTLSKRANDASLGTAVANTAP